MMTYFFRNTSGDGRYSPSFVPIRSPDLKPPWSNTFYGLKDEPAPNPDHTYKFHFKKDYRRLSGFINLGQGLNNAFVSQVVRELIESIEPGVHQFLPLDLRNRSGASFPVPYWALHIRTWIDCIVLEKSPLITICRNQLYPEDWRYFMRHTPLHKEDVALRAEPIAGHHLWRATNSVYMFMSDELRALMKKTKVSGAEFFEMSEVFDC